MIQPIFDHDKMTLKTHIVGKRYEKRRINFDQWYFSSNVEAEIQILFISNLYAYHMNVGAKLKYLAA